MTKFKNMQQVKGRSKPLGGAPPVKIPPLNAEPVAGGGSMQDQAAALRDEKNPLSPHYNPQAGAAEDQAAENRMDPNKRPPMGQTLPPEAAQDPRFRHGVGSAFAANQPDIQKPQQGQGQPGLSSQTAEGLQAIQNFQAAAEEEQRKSTEVTEDDIKADDEERARDYLKELGIADPEAFIKAFRQEIDQSDMNTPEVKKAIEERCKPLDLVQMLEDGEARQDVPIVRDKFIVTYRTVTGDEDLEMKRLLYGVQGGDQYLYDLLSMYQLVAGLYSINGKALPSHLKDGSWDKELFIAKAKRVRKFPMAMLASMSINGTWFDQRTRALFVDVEGLKNG